MKIVFFINSLQQQRCYKRMREFQANGYEIEAYGFEREGNRVPMVEGISVTTIGYIPFVMPYHKRMQLMYNSIKPIARQYKNDRNTIFYYFLLDIAIAARLCTRHNYIYEESDISQAYIKNPLVRHTLDIIDRNTIRHSLLTVFTSSGFIEYHYGNKTVRNAVIVPNRLDKRILDFPYTPEPTDVKHLRFAYIGHIRHRATLTFANTIATQFPQHEMHLYGTIRPELHFEDVKAPNIITHGSFINPDDLPQIYSQTDIVIAPEYDENEINGRYAEPNKLYDAIYFRRPIITNPDTHTADIILQRHIGYVINFTVQEITDFVNSLTADKLQRATDSLNAIPQHEALNDNPLLFDKLMNSKNCKYHGLF